MGLTIVHLPIVPVVTGLAVRATHVEGLCRESLPLSILLASRCPCWHAIHTLTCCFSRKHHDHIQHTHPVDLPRMPISKQSLRNYVERTKIPNFASSYCGPDVSSAKHQKQSRRDHKPISVVHESRDSRHRLSNLVYRQ